MTSAAHQPTFAHLAALLRVEEQRFAASRPVSRQLADSGAEHLLGSGPTSWMSHWATHELSRQPQLERYLHLHALNRGVLITPFHNMFLACPSTTDDVDQVVSVFGEAVQTPVDVG